MLEYSFTYANLEYFLLIIARVASFIFIAPFFGMNNTPRRLKAALSIFISLVLYGALPHTEVVYHTLIGYFMIVMKEVVTGLLIGLGANLCTYIVALAGHLADMEMGLSMASAMDPTTMQQTTISGIYYNYMVMLMLIISGMHRYLLRAFAETYQLIPVNGAILRTDALLQTMLSFLANYVLIGFQICLPIFAVMIILNAVLGVLAKVSPQLNMFAVGIQIKVLVGISILFVSTAMLPDAAEFIYDQMKTMVVAFVEAMA